LGRGIRSCLLIFLVSLGKIWGLEKENIEWRRGWGDSENVLSLVRRGGSREISGKFNLT
jgi:hypothetical protein